MATPGVDNIDTLLVDVRASTQGFEQDIAAMRGAVDGTLVEGFARAGIVLERGLLGAIRRGSLGFDDLKRIALSTVNAIAAQSVRSLFSTGGAGGGLAGLLDFGGLVGSLLGLPGRATGGTVAPGRGYLVGEDGPEVFVPTSAGRVERLAAAKSGRAADQRPDGTSSRDARALAHDTRLAPRDTGGLASPAAAPGTREVRVAINLVTPQGASVPRSLQRSTRQLASAVRRAIAYS